MKIALILIAQFFFIFVPAYSDTTPKSYQKVQRAFYVMGTSLEFNLLCKNRTHCLDAINESIVEVNRIDKIFSNYRADSELSAIRINKDQYIKVSREFFELTGFSYFISALTNGAFDISVGPLVDIWKKEAKKNKIPKTSLIESIRDKCIGFDKLKLYSIHKKIGFSSSCIKLDYGAVGKGHVLKKLAELSVSKKIENGLINFGGNIHALGKDLDGKPWVIKIKDPDNSNKYIKTINVSNMSVSTSGGYERYFLVKDRKYSHIIDPRTGFPVSRFSSVTVVSENPLFADALSTAFSVLSIEESKKIIDQLDKIAVLIIEKHENEINIYNNDNFNKLVLN